MIRRPPSARRRGYVLYIVMVVVVVLSLVAWQYSDAMTSEAAAATRAHDSEQLKANAASGVYHAAAVLTDPAYDTYSLEDDSALFAGLTVGLGEQPAEGTPQHAGDANARRLGGRFSLLNLSDGGGGYGTAVRYGLEDESRKLNVNGLIQLDPVGNALHDALMKLPSMTEEIADAIVDWVDADATARPNGAEDDVYSPSGYHCKNGPIHTLGELLLVRGVTPDLLYGSDRNMNGVQDANEAAGSDGAFSRGWSEFLTCYGREINVDQKGLPRVNLNGNDLQKLNDDLMSLDETVMSRELADYILYFRISGSGETFQPTLPAGREPAVVQDLRALVDAAVTNNLPMRKGFGSVFTILNTQIRLRPKVAPGPNGQPMQVIPVVPGPLNDVASLGTVVELLLDRCSISEDYELTPRLNVNTAPKEVLACLPGLDSTDVDNIVSNRPTPGTQPTAAWLVKDAKLTPDKFKNIEPYIVGRSGAYRVRSVGYFGTGGQQSTVEAVIEVVVQDLNDGNGPQAKPRIVAFRPIDDLGGKFADLPR